MAAVFSPTEAAFEGFRIINQKPLAVLAWAAVSVVLGAISSVVSVSMAGADIMALQALGESQQQPAPAEVFALLGRAAPAILIGMSLALIGYGVAYAGATQAVLRPQEGAPLHTSFGMAALLQAVLLVVAFVLFFLIFSVLGFVTGFAGTLIGMLLPEALRGVFSALMIVALVCAFTMLSVRLSLASVMTFDESRLRFFGSWALTRGQFWPLLGAFVLASAIALVVYLIVLGAFFVIVLGVNGFEQGALSNFFKPDMSSLQAYFTPSMVAYLIVVSLLKAFLTAMVIGTCAHIYAQLQVSRSQ